MMRERGQGVDGKCSFTYTHAAGWYRSNLHEHVKVIYSQYNTIREKGNDHRSTAARKKEHVSITKIRTLGKKGSLGSDAVVLLRKHKPFI